MLWTHILYSLLCAYTAAAASIPRHEPQQHPLSENQAAGLDSQAINVMLAFTESESSMEQLAQIPLHKRIFPGYYLPRKLSTIKIISAATGQGHSVSLERLDSITCRIITDVDNKKEKTTGKEASASLPWFSLKDGTVRVNDRSSEWFLGNRAITGYECR